MSDASIEGMIKLCKAKARLWENAARALEDAAKAEGLTNAAANGAAPLLPKLGVATPELIRETIKDKAKRIADIATELSVDRRDVERIVEDSANGFIVGDRGWIKIR